MFSSTPAAGSAGAGVFLADSFLPSDVDPDMLYGRPPGSRGKNRQKFAKEC